jgi:glycosyltransferase involved in cell wall biosynthesis
LSYGGKNTSDKNENRTNLKEQAVKKNVMKKAQIIQALKSRKLVTEKSITIECDCVSAIANIDLIETYLLVSRVKYWEWKDPSGAILCRQKAPKILFNLTRDALLWPLLYLYIRNIITPKGTRTRPPVKKNNTKSILFLRTDHWFNIKSGGSVGHLSGVIDGFRSLGNVTRVVSSDLLANVKEDTHFLCIKPQYKTGRNLPNFSEMLHSITLYNKLLPQLDDWSADLIYQRYSLGNFTGVLLSRKANIPYVCEYNGSFPWMARHWERRPIFHEKLISQIEMMNLNAAVCIVVVSQPMKDELVNRGISPQKILVNPNGVNPETYSPLIDGSRVRKCNGLNEKIVIGFIGTFGKWHGAEVLADAFGKLLQKHPQYKESVRLLLIGDGIMMPEVRATIVKYHVERESILPGMIPQERGPEYLASCDILASPHIPNPDGTPFFGSPTKLFEYMAMGKPIVASDLDQLGEILVHKKTAYMVKPADSEALMHGIKTLIDNKDLRDHIGKDARKEAEEKYTWVQHTKRIIDKLNSLS